MSAVRVQVPYRVPYADTDRMGVVYYGNYLTYFERARNELLRELGLTYRALEEMGYGLPVVEATVRYRRPAEYDDLVRIEAWLGRLGAARVVVHCAVYRDETLLTEGSTVHAFVDVDSLRPTRMPAEVIELFRGAGEGADG